MVLAIDRRAGSACKSGKAFKTYIAPNLKKVLTNWANGSDFSAVQGTGFFGIPVVIACNDNDEISKHLHLIPLPQPIELYRESKFSDN